MKRKSALKKLVQYECPIPSVLYELAQFDWDATKELVTLEFSHIQNILQLFRNGEISSNEVEAWANAIEGRDDIKIENMQISELLFELANPSLTQLLTPERAYFWLTKLHN